uniref:(northern house mosquito) hypothetical protein n=1 Tax=Culex pipiens TaxID=7175 RepID=A0A8D8JSK3_CULPI
MNLMKIWPRTILSWRRRKLRRRLSTRCIICRTLPRAEDQTFISFRTSAARWVAFVCSNRSTNWAKTLSARWTLAAARFGASNCRSRYSVRKLSARGQRYRLLTRQLVE